MLSCGEKLPRQNARIAFSFARKLTRDSHCAARESLNNIRNLCTTDFDFSRSQRVEKCVHVCAGKEKLG